MIDYLMSLNPIILALLACLFTYAFTALGASVVIFFKNVNRNIMDAMLGFAAGVMISASFWSLLSPGIEMANEQGKIAWLVASIGFLSGGLILFIGDKVCNLFMDKLKSNNKSSFKRSLMLIFSITLHNIPEGLAVGVAFGALASGFTEAALLSAIVLAFGIGLQNFPEGSAVSLPLRREGYSRGKSFFYGQLSGIVEPIAGVIGAMLVTKMQSILPFFLCFAAGAMIYVVVEELIPESQSNKRKDLMALFTLVGFTVMMILDVALG